MGTFAGCNGLMGRLRGAADPAARAGKGNHVFSGEFSRKNMLFHAFCAGL